MSDSTNSSQQKLVLVTGGTGFLAAHSIIQLLAAGYRVRTTLRSLDRKAAVLEMLKTGGANPSEQLSFFIADLLSDKGWPEAVAGCDYTLHLASPFPSKMPKDENELIIPAREGSLRVLRAARDAGVKRVVMTSSFAAVGYGHKSTTETFTEKNWTDPNNKTISAYIRSKTLAEKAAWDFIANEGAHLELSVVNPVAIFGPLLGPDFPSSILVLKQMLDGDIKACPRVYFNAVDVRDVADLHIRAMTNPAAKGERFLALAGNCMSMHYIAMVLKNRLGDAAKHVPTKELSNWMVRLAALFNPAAKQVAPELGKIKNASNEKARSLLGWSPQTNEEAIAASAEGLIRLGLVKK